MEHEDNIDPQITTSGCSGTEAHVSFKGTSKYSHVKMSEGNTGTVKLVSMIQHVNIKITFHAK